MNFFFAIELSEDACQTVANLAARWQAQLGARHHARWYEAADYHVTVKFLGDIPADIAREIAEPVRKIAGTVSPFRIHGAPAGAFPDLTRPSVLWAGVERGADLENLAARVDEAAASFGIPRETRRYHPHVTLARTKGDPVPLPECKQAFESVLVDRLVLMQTMARQNGAPVASVRYNTVQVFPFSQK